VVSVIKDIEGEYKNKNILIVSHGDPILLLKAFYNKWGLDEILKEKKNIKVGEFHELRRKNT
jgi:broad specificity phosphatase PhoE